MGPDSFRTPFTLRGRYAELIPLEKGHRDALRVAANHPEIGRYLRHGPGRTLEEMDGLIDALLTAQASGTDLPFTTCILPDHRPVGMTRYLRIDRANQWVEIGGTWLDVAYWRTPVNTETKYLLMRHAFEREGAHRVQLQTDSRNERSQRAIARLGAVREGILREDVLLPDRYFRSSVYYSVLESEWPGVKSRLETYLARPWAPSARPGPTRSD
jgi:N-acetyltransferase